MTCSICGTVPTPRVIQVNRTDTLIEKAVVTCKLCSATLTFCATCLEAGRERSVYFWLAGVHRGPCESYEGKDNDMKISITFADCTPDVASKLIAVANGQPAVAEMQGHGKVKLGLKGKEEFASSAIQSDVADALNKSDLAKDPPKAKKVAPPAVETADEEDEPVEEPKPVTKPKIVIDTSKIKALAEGNPAKKPKAKPAPVETDDDAEEEEAPPAKAKANGTNGHAKVAPPPADVDDEEDEEDENGGDVPAALFNAKKLRDVLNYFMQEEGIEDVDVLKKRCAEIKKSVPCLDRISELDSRIDRTLEVMDLSADLS